MADKYENISFWMPIQAVISKGSKDSTGADTEGRRWIQGIASTDDVDLQGEIVEQQGIDFSYFLKYGYFNDDHKAGPEFKIGEPTDCKVTSRGLWVKGFLHKGNKHADAYWEKIKSLDMSDSRRRIGFSIQGKVISKVGNRIKKCWIQDIAITPQPVNAATWAEVAKSLRATSLTNPSNVVEKSLNFPQAVAFLQTQHSLSREAAEAVAKLVFSAKELKQ